MLDGVLLDGELLVSIDCAGWSAVVGVVEIVFSGTFSDSIALEVLAILVLCRLNYSL